jgi:tight adherence protein B
MWPLLATVVAERQPFIRRPWLAALLASVGLLLALPEMAAAASTPLTGWLGTGTTFPQRAMVLFGPSGKRLSSADVHVTENGAAVSPLTVTPSAEAGARDFGFVVVLDQNKSMNGRPLQAAVAAVQSLARQRSAGQELGLVTFDSTPSVFLPLTSEPVEIRSILSSPVETDSGANVTAGIQTALGQLAQARVALAAIVVVSDGVGNLTGAATPSAVKVAAAAAQVPVFTIGVKDKAASAASLKALSHASPGQFVQSTPSGLAGLYKKIYATVTRGDVVRWRSAVHSNRPVAVAAHVDGVPGTVAASYDATSLPAATAAPRPAHPAATVHPTSQLSGAPSFNATPTPAPATAAPATRSSFWASPAAVPAVALICGLLFAAMVLFAFYRPSRRAVRVRVSSFIPSEETGDGLTLNAAPEPKSLLAKLEHNRWWPPFVLDVEIARSPHTPFYLVKRAAVIGVVVAAFCLLIMGSALLAFVPLLGWPFVLRSLVKRKARKQRELFRDTLPAYLSDLASAIRVGRSFTGALTVVAETADEPTKSELQRSIRDEALGRPLDESLEAVAERMEAPDLDQVALVAALNRRSGSNVAEALDRVAEGARERAELRREVRALTAQAKMSSWVLTSLPGFLLIGVNVISPLYAHPLFHTTIGVVLLGVGAMMVFGGWKVMGKITEIKI